MRYLWLGLLVLSCPAGIFAQSSLASRVLVVYASNDVNSASVATYYQSKRGIPSANMCPLTLPSPSAIGLSASDYAESVQTPVQNCLNAAGRQNILYIVLAYTRPFGVDPGSGLGWYALDSYLADIWDQYTTQAFDPAPSYTHPYYVENQSQGDVYTPFESLASYRALGTLPLIYSVWRLDGATPAIATGLVDKALAAEAAGGPISQTKSQPNACIDMLIDPTTFPDSGYRAADWDLLRASQFLSETSNFDVIADELGSNFGTPPSPDCPNTALYAGWYNYDAYNNAFSWDSGSIGWDLDSDALFDPRSGPTWGTNALINGVTVTSGPITEPYLEGMARPSGVMRNLLEGANVGDAFLRNTRWLKWQILNVGDPLYIPFPSKIPPFNAPVTANSLSLYPREVVGGAPVAATVTVSTSAPTGGLKVNLSSNSASFPVPTSVTIPAGASSASFLATSSAVTESATIAITASTSSMSVGNTMLLDPLLSGVEFSENSVTGGSPVTATVYLNASASLGGAVVALTSSTPGVASVPPSVAIPAGLSATNFSITTYAVSSSTNVNITSTYAGASTVATLAVVP
ncbi:MAG: TIGR03790 family protein [Bryobacteraceae bacterium]